MVACEAIMGPSFSEVHSDSTSSMQRNCALLEVPKASVAQVLFLVIGHLEPLGGPRFLRQLRPASKASWLLAVRVDELIEVHTGRITV